MLSIFSVFGLAYRSGCARAPKPGKQADLATAANFAALFDGAMTAYARTYATTGEYPHAWSGAMVPLIWHSTLAPLEPFAGLHHMFRQNGVNSFHGLIDWLRTPDVRRRIYVHTVDNFDMYPLHPEPERIARDIEALRSGGHFEDYVQNFIIEQAPDEGDFIYRDLAVAMQQRAENNPPAPPPPSQSTGPSRRRRARSTEPSPVIEFQSWCACTGNPNDDTESRLLYLRNGVWYYTRR